MRVHAKHVHFLPTGAVGVLDSQMIASPPSPPRIPCDSYVEAWCSQYGLLGPAYNDFHRRIRHISDENFPTHHRSHRRRLLPREPLQDARGERPFRAPLLHRLPAGIRAATTGRAPPRFPLPLRVLLRLHGLPSQALLPDSDNIRWVSAQHEPRQAKKRALTCRG